MNYIDNDLALQYSYSNEILKTLYNNFLEEYKNFSLKTLYSSKEEVLMYVHKIKGISLNLGAQKLYEVSLELENTLEYEKTLKKYMYIFNKSYNEIFNF